MTLIYILDVIDEILPLPLDREKSLMELIDHSLKKDFSNPMKGKNIAAILSGARNIPKSDAKEILKNFDSGYLKSYIEKMLNTGNRNLNIDNFYEKMIEEDFDFNIQSMDKSNVPEYFCKIWEKYLKNCRDEIHRRTSHKKTNIVIKPEDINSRLRKVINAIQYFDEEIFNNINPKYVREKIDKEKEWKLFQKIETNVIDYYDDIKNLFVEEQESEDLVYNEVRSEIRMHYLNTKGESQHEIFNKLVDWLASEVDTTDREACEAVMSYFVQSCEVFGK